MLRASSQVYLLVNVSSKLFEGPLFFSGLLSYLVGIKRRTHVKYLFIILLFKSPSDPDLEVNVRDLEHLA